MWYKKEVDKQIRQINKYYMLIDSSINEIHTYGENFRYGSL